MAWIEFHDDIWEHHKTERFADMLGLPVVYAVGHLASLWHFVLRNAWKDANLEPWGDKGIARAARWEGEPAKFVQALKECGFLDNYVAHGWGERAGKLVQDRLYNEERKKNADLRRKADATLPNPTQPNPTTPHQTDFAPSLETSALHVLVFPCVGSVRAWGLTQEKLDEYRESFPGLPALDECRKARQWLLDNPTRRKTASGMSRFIGSWLGRVQNSGRLGQREKSTRIVGGAAPTPGKYDAIERIGQ